MNLMASLGAGKTTLLSRIIKDMNAKVPIAVCEADIASAVDAERIESSGATAVQVHTDGMCHMDAGMTSPSSTPLCSGRARYWSSQRWMHCPISRLI